MARQELAARYIGTLGGVAWLILQPLTTVLVFWFVFSVGFKATSPDGTPFILYFVTGYVPWLLFMEVLSGSTNGVIGNAHLVRKVAFPTEIIPFVYLLAGIVPHVFLMFIAIGMARFYGIDVSFHLLTIGYYLFAMCLFTIGLSWLCSALNVFYRDLGQGLSIVLNFWFWLSPIVWATNMIPEDYMWVIDYNPMFYVIDGYRNSILYHNHFFPSLFSSAYYWIVTFILLAIGGGVFRRLKREFADVL